MNNPLTKEELAARLNGREIGAEVTPQDALQAKNAGLVIVYGASDDLMEFEGAFTDEADVYQGRTIGVHRGGALEPHIECTCKFCGYGKLADACFKIEAVWHQGAYAWTYRTNLPHATFDILEDGEKYCRGIVFNLTDLPVVTWP